ncbi:MAG: DUF6371 domain-containing protein [Chlorobiaceae bacterium]
MPDYRFALEKSGLKYTCPQCGKLRFVRYVDTCTGEQIADHVGRCDREDSCGYHLRPREYLQLTGQNPFTVTKPAQKPEPIPKPEPSFMDAEILQQTLAKYNQNNFCRWLCSRFGEQKAFELTAVYNIGTSKHWPGSCLFWQIDRNRKIRTGKIMLYHSETGRRVKEPFNHVQWVHKVMKLEPYHLQQCLFGEHLLALDTVKPIAIVESEKTAIVASGFVSDFIWLATGGKGNIKKEQLKTLQGRTMKLYPDLGAFEKWKRIASGMPNITVSDILERRATEAEKKQGFDLADYLLQSDCKTIALPEPEFDAEKQRFSCKVP